MTVRTIASTSVHVTGSSRLPMVAGWDRLLPSWFSRLHPRYKTPINSIIFVGALTLVIAIASQIGAGIQEAFQLVDNAANVFYGIVYFTMFAIPIFGAAAIRSRRSNLVAHRGNLRRCRLAICDFFHRLSDYRRSKPVEFRGENHCRDRNRERDWRRDLRSLARNVSAPDRSSRLTQRRYSGRPLATGTKIISGTS